jgi:hypothetical protein
MFNLFKKKIQEEEVVAKGFSCPYCSVILEKEPARKQKCKSCNNEFSVRTHYLTHKKVVLTEDQLLKYESELNRYTVVNDLIDGLKRGEDVDVKAIDKLLDETQKELTKKFNMKPFLGDIAWGTSHKLLAEAVKKGDENRLRSIYSSMMMYLYSTDKDFSAICHKLLEMDISTYKKADIKKLEILAEGCCENCSKLNGKIIDIDEAVKNKILPCKDCTKDTNKMGIGLCSCAYLPSFEE